MKLLDLTLPTGEENLALDEALLELSNQTAEYDDVLRIWEPHAPMVVLGRASKATVEVDLDFCRQQGIPVLRRCSGGATVVSMPGCVMYAVTLCLDRFPALRVIDKAHQYVLNRIGEAVSSLTDGVKLDGTSDLTIGKKKFSGNSLRCKANAILYHGTILNDSSLELISRCLKMPPRQPDYRNQRSHLDFLMNLKLDRDALVEQIIRRWDAKEPIKSWPKEDVSRLVKERYSQQTWNFRH